MKSKPSVVLISIDGMKPEFLFGSKNIEMELPNLKKYFIENGTYASGGVQSVFPTFTYPCHQTIITGTNPVKHGISNNQLFDPTGKHKGAWNWITSSKVKNLWEESKLNSYVSGSASFPTSAGAKGDYIAPEFWFDGTDFDSQLLDLIARPQGLISEMEKEIGRFASGYELTDESDEQRFKELLYLIENKLSKDIDEKPFFVSGYFASFDESAHQHGVYSEQAKASLVKIDEMVGRIVRRVHEITKDNVIVCVVSDHGVIDNRFNISPNVLFREKGLLEADESGRIISWKAYAQRAGGTCEIRLKNSDDKAVAAEVKAILLELVHNENSGIYEVLDKSQCIDRGGFPAADFALVAKAGYEIREDVVGSYLTADIHQKAQHGYSEFYDDMRASFLIEGKGIQKNRCVGKIKLVDIAPTLANLMGFELEGAEGSNIL